MSLGQRIRQLRQMRGLTQSRLGGGELSKSFISLLEKDRTRPSVETLQLLAQRLGTSVDALLGQDGHIPEMTTNGVLSLSREAIRHREFAKTSELLKFAHHMATTYRLDEALRESQLQAAEVAIEQRAFAEAWTQLELAHKGSEQARDFWRIGRAVLLMGWVKVRLRDIPEAARLFQQALAILRRARAGRDQSRVEALIGLGTAFTYLGRFSSALRRYEEAANSEVAKLDGVLRGRALWGIGVVHRKMGRYEVARDYLVKAKDALESAEELPDLMRVLHNLGQLLFQEGQAKEALRYFHQALRVMERLQMPMARASTLTEIGRVHFSLGNLEDTEHFAGQALALAREIDDPVEIAEAEVVLARVYSTRNETIKAISLLKEAVGTFKERKMKARLTEAARELGTLLRARGAHAEAVDYFALAAEQAERQPEATSLVEL